MVEADENGKPTTEETGLLRWLVEDDGKSLLKSLAIILAVAFAALVAVFSTAIVFREDAKAAGAWGDFVGGTLNPIFSFLAFFAILITIVIQQMELRLTRREIDRSANALESQHEALERQLDALDRQTFEATLFQMMRSHADITSRITARSYANQELTALTGRPAITRWMDIFKTHYQNATNHYPDDNEALSKAYEAYWENARIQFAHYFRYLYNVFRFINLSNYSSGPYAKLMRSQLSDEELVLLYYNVKTRHGRKFSKYTEMYDIFDNLEVSFLLHPNHVNLGKIDLK